MDFIWCENLCDFLWFVGWEGFECDCGVFEGINFVIIGLEVFLGEWGFIFD